MLCLRFLWYIKRFLIIIYTTWKITTRTSAWIFFILLFLNHRIMRKSNFFFYTWSRRIPKSPMIRKILFSHLLSPICIPHSMHDIFQIQKALFHLFFLYRVILRLYFTIISFHKSMLGRLKNFYLYVYPGLL